MAGFGGASHDRNMKIFFGVVHNDKKSSYGIHFPDVPGCFSAADSSDDLIPNASEALALFFSDGENVPEPSDIEEIRKLAAEDIAEGAVLLAVPFQ